VSEPADDVTARARDVTPAHGGHRWLVRGESWCWCDFSSAAGGSTQEYNVGGGPSANIAAPGGGHGPRPPAASSGATLQPSAGTAES